MSILTQPLYEQFGAPTLLYRNLCAWVDSPAAGPHAATPWIRCQSEFNASNHLTTETRLMELDAMHLLTRVRSFSFVYKDAFLLGFLVVLS